jgi:hypothetical protein
MRVQQQSDRSPPIRVHGGVGRDVETKLHVGRGCEFGQYQLKHAAIDQPDQAELLRYGHDIGFSGRVDVTVASFQDTADASDLKDTVCFGTDCSSSS